MDKGQHIRLFIKDGSNYDVIAMATDLTLHGSATTENTTTKDTTDAAGVAWDEFEVTQRSADIQFSALVASGTDSAAKLLNDIETGVSDAEIDWEIALASGANNRTKGTVICSGKGKITNMQATGQVGQNATYSGTINTFGPITVPA